MIEQKIRELIGHDLPAAPKPLAAYIPAIQSGNLVMTAGQLPFKDGKLLFEGKVGYEVSEEKGIECAKQSALNCLSATSIKSKGLLNWLFLLILQSVIINNRKLQTVPQNWWYRFLANQANMQEVLWELANYQWMHLLK